MSRPPARIRLRRRLLLASALPVLIAVLAAVKLISVVIVGNSAQDNFSAGNIGALGDDVAVLEMVDVVEPAITARAAGGLAVLQDRLDAADAQFSSALARTGPDQSCEVRINLELVRERRADIDAWEARPELARQRYSEALTLIADAPPACFSRNDDPDPQRRAVREDATVRVQAKLAGLGVVTPLAPPPPPPPAAPAAPPPPVAAVPTPDDLPDTRRLDVGGDPLDVLRQVLRDAAG